MSTVTVRQARPADHDDVVAFASDTWADREGVADYLPDVFSEWVETDGPTQRTLVAETSEVVGVCQFVLLSDHEAWAQGMRVAPAARGRGVAAALTAAGFDWARERGASVCRNMVFSWNQAGLGTARGVGFDPCTEFRWVYPDPDPDPDSGSDSDNGTPGGADSGAGSVDVGDDTAAETGTRASDDLTVACDPDAAWSHWRRSDACDHLRGLGIDPGESWALSEVTRRRLRRAAGERGVLAVRDSGGTRGAAARTRTFEREGEGENGTVRWAEYGFAAWADTAAAETLLAAVARDATDRGADRSRVLVPETVRHVSDVASAGVGLADDPDFVLEADLTGTDCPGT